MLTIVEDEKGQAISPEIRFMQLPPCSIFNDYTLLFNLKSNILFRSYSPTFNKTLRKKDTEQHITVTMNIEAEKF